MLIPKDTHNAETLKDLSKEVATKIEESQNQIYEIIGNQRDYRLKNIEVQAVLDGLVDWLIRQGFGDLEIHYLMKDMDIDQEAFVN